jgi:hypothetical protein
MKVSCMLHAPANLPLKRELSVRSLDARLRTLLYPVKPILREAHDEFTQLSKAIELKTNGSLYNIGLQSWISLGSTKFCTTFNCALYI